MHRADDAHGLFETGLFERLRSVNVVAGGHEAGGVHLGAGLRVKACAAGEVDHVHIFFHEQSLTRGIVGGDAALGAIRTVHADFDDHVVAHHFPNALDDHEREAYPVFHRATVAVGALVAERREEIVHQPAVPVMEHNGIKQTAPGLTGGHDVHLGNCFHVFFGHFMHHAAVVHECAGPHGRAHFG